jgi:DNA replication protein DnaC
MEVEEKKAKFLLFHSIALEFFNIEKKDNIEFIADAAWKHKVANAVIWLAQLEGTWNEKKWLYLYGITGSRKTFFVRVMQEYLNRVPHFHNPKYPSIALSLKISHSTDIVKSFVSFGYDGLKDYINAPLLCIDDLGDESPQSNHFATKDQPCGVVIKERELKDRRTIITTNLHPDSILEAYGDRVDSRLRRVAKHILMDSIDYRRI